MPKPRPPQSETTFHILLALAEEPLHGYGIMVKAAEMGVKIGPGTIYGALHRMVQAGWVERAGSEKARGPTKKRHRYSLTLAGRDLLRMEARRITRAADLVRASAIPID